MTQYTPQHGHPEPQESYPQPAYAQPAPQAAYPPPPAPGYAPAGQPAARGYPPAGYAYLPTQQSPYGSPGTPLSPTTAAALAPGVGGVIGYTLLFGLFGAISASNRANKAKALGLPSGKYWGAYFGTLAVTILSSIGMIMVLMLALSSVSGTVTSTSLERSIITNGDFKTGDGSPATVTDATCTKKVVDSDGAGTYTCLIDFSDNTRGSYTVTADADGKWVTDGGE